MQWCLVGQTDADSAAGGKVWGIQAEERPNIPCLHRPQGHRLLPGSSAQGSPLYIRTLSPIANAK